jgi:F420-dependent oxidoreductase-like protein
MKIGIAVGDVRGPATVDDLVSQVQVAADAGLHTAWSAQAFGWDALVALATAGIQVSSIGLGTAVVPVAQRHPLVLASQALSVQAAIGGRLQLGVGVGVAAMLESSFGLRSTHPVRRVREYLPVLQALLRGEAVEHRSETLTAVGSVDLPGTPAPPVLLAALGPAMLTVAGEMTDGAITWMTGPRTLADHIVPTVTRAAEAAGRPRPRVVAGVLVAVTDDTEAVRRHVEQRFGLAGRVPEYRAVLDRENAAGPADVALIGDESAVTEGIARLAATGITDLLAAPVGTPADIDRTVTTLAHTAAGTAPTGIRPSAIGPGISTRS